MRFRGAIFFIALIIATVLISGYALAGCITPVPLPPNFAYQTPPTSLGGTGIITGQILDAPSNCIWKLPISVALVNATGFSVIDHGYGGIQGTISIFDGPYSCTPSESYTLTNIPVTGPGNITYKVVIFYRIPPPNNTLLIGTSPGFTIEEMGDTVTHDLLMFFDYWRCEHPTPTTTANTTATTTTTTTTTGTATMNTTVPTTVTTTYTTTITTSTMTPFPTTTFTIPTSTQSPTVSTTEAPWPGLGVVVLILLVYAFYMSRRG